MKNNQEDNIKPKFNFQKNTSDSVTIKSHHPVRRLLIFQVKLAADALRDILLSPISIVASLIDLTQGRKGKDRSKESTRSILVQSQKLRF